MITKSGLKVYFQDEGRFGRITNLNSCWAPAKLRPILTSQIIREYTHVYSTICPDDGDTFSMILPYANTQCMDYFINRFEAYRKEESTLMFIDQASWHTTNNLKELDWLRFEYQPPYSPELNPVELYWKYLRE